MLGEVPADANTRARIIGSADQKFTWFTPTLELADGPEPSRMHLGRPAPTGEITGPCAFGGCSQLCCDVKFDAHKLPKGAQLSDIGVIVKRKPKGMAQALRELLTTADTYTIEFTDPSLTPEKKASVLTSLLLLDVRAAKQSQAKPNEASGILPACAFPRAASSPPPLARSASTVHVLRGRRRHVRHDLRQQAVH